MGEVARKAVRSWVVLTVIAGLAMGCGGDPAGVWCDDCTDQEESTPSEPSVRVTPPPSSPASFPPESFELFGDRYCQSTVDVSATSFDGGGVLGVSFDGGLSFDFRAGDTAATDRLLVGFKVNSGTTGTHLFELTGPNTDGIFDASSSIEYLRGPNVDETIGGRPNSVLYLAGADRGPTDSYDIALFTFVGDDHVRMYDRQNLTDGVDATINDALSSTVKASTVNGGVLEEAPSDGYLLYGVQDRTTGEMLLGSFHIDTATFESNAVNLSECCGVPSGSVMGDLARLPSGEYLASIRDTAEPGLLRLAVDDSGATLNVTSYDFEPLSEEVSGLAVGRTSFNAPTIYASTRDDASGEVGMVTFIPVTTSSDCSSL